MLNFHRKGAKTPSYRKEIFEEYIEKALRYLCAFASLRLGVLE
jgi:hypothetical protein